MKYTTGNKCASPNDEVSDHAGPAQEARYLTFKELCAVSKLSASTLRRLIRLGVIKCFQPGGHRHRIVFPPDAIEQATASLPPPTASGGSAAGDAGPPRRGPSPKWLKQT